MKLAWAIWTTLFGVLLTFVMGVIVWSLVGPVFALIIYAAAVFLFVWIPYRTTKRPPHPGG